MEAAPPQTAAEVTLYAALAGAQAIAGSVAKDARNPHHGYSYASAEAVIQEARTALSSAGLLVVGTKCSTSW